MAMGFTVREAASADAAAIIELWNVFVRETTVTFTSDLKTEAGIAADIAARGPEFLVAMDGDVFLGFATSFAFRSGSGYARTREHSIMLAPEARGRGVGRALMEALCRAAKDNGAHSMIAAVSAENQDGVAFHKAIGFDEVGMIPQSGTKFGRWLDVVMMQKFL